jgi:hypothetical protein
MTPQFSGQEVLDEIYGLLCTAASRKQPIAALYDLMETRAAIIGGPITRAAMKMSAA